jgi:3-hydroxyacyl-CoA dehydrogenase/3-hydroxy-2-methylbutyryl-CoA dehydrogenase
MELKGRSAIVTGGAGGLGSAAARRLASAGMGVVVFDIDGEGAETVAKELETPGEALVGTTIDADDVTAAIEVASALGPLSAVVNVAGGGAGDGRTIHRDGQPHSQEAFVKTVEANLFGTFNVTRLACARMAANAPDEDGQRGVVVNTSSIAAQDGQAGTIGYTAAKAAVAGMSLTLARDLSIFGIRACAILPGSIASPAALRTSDKFRESILANVAFPRRLGDPDEFGSLVESIVRNPYLNGENIRLDAGLRLPPK